MIYKEDGRWFGSKKLIIVKILWWNVENVQICSFNVWTGRCWSVSQNSKVPMLQSKKKRLIFLIFARSIYLSLYLQIKMTVLFRFDSFTFSTHIIIKSSLNVLFNQTYCLFCTNIRVFLDFFCKCFCSFCFVLVCVVGFFLMLLFVWNVFSYDNFIYKIYIVPSLKRYASVYSEKSRQMVNGVWVCVYVWFCLFIWKPTWKHQRIMQRYDL